MGLTTLFLPSAGGSPGLSALEIRRTAVPIITGHVYKLMLRVKSTLAQNLNVKIDNSTGASVSLNQYKVIPADEWRQLQFSFTAIATDNASRLRILPEVDPQTIKIDKVILWDLTLERKQYRIMRITGSMMPGSFIQTLTLREVTSAETA